MGHLVNNRLDKAMEREAFYRSQREVVAKRYKEFEPNAVEALFDMVQTYNVIETKLASRIQAHGLTLAGLNVLAILRRHAASGCPLNRLSDLLLVSRANITGVIDNLVRKGFVGRSEHQADRRICLARITRQGEAFLDKYFPNHYKEIAQMFTGLTTSEKKTLTHLLTKLRHHIVHSPRVAVGHGKGV